MRSHGKSADFSEREEQNTVESGFMELSDSRNDMVVFAWLCRFEQFPKRKNIVSGVEKGDCFRSRLIFF
jgi:hypothetical protein